MASPAAQMMGVAGVITPPQVPGGVRNLGAAMPEVLTVRLPNVHKHPKQRRFIISAAKRKVVRAGRRGGKTIGAAVLATLAFLNGRRVLYAVPTDDQKAQFWDAVKRFLRDGIERGVYRKNETTCVIRLPYGKGRIRAKTAWDPDTLRGDYADLLILDEAQLMRESAWAEVGAPMLLDNDGDAVFIYTPPSLRSRARSRARDPRWVTRLFERARRDGQRWRAFHFTSYDNPFISRTALAEIVSDMTELAYRQEILAEDVDENPAALWRREWIERGRVTEAPPLERVVVAVDPSGSSDGDAIGIVVGGVARQGGVTHWYTLADRTLHGKPDEWARAAVSAYIEFEADYIVAESNFGGEMVASVLHQVDPTVPVRLVHASRGKAVRADPVSAIYAQGRAHHVGGFPALEDELCLWTPGDPSPNRLDALVWGVTELVINRKGRPAGQVARGALLGHRRRR